MTYIYIPTPQRTDNQKVAGEFYPLQKEELMALRQAKLINNTAYVHLALRFENPWCDRPVEVIPKEFALRWAIPESSVYEAVAKLKQLGILQIKSGKLVVEWAAYSQQGSFSGNPEFSQPAKPKTPAPYSHSQQDSDSGNPEKILRFQKIFRDPRKNSETSENRGSESWQNLASISSQTIQTLQTNQTRGGEKIFSQQTGINDKHEDEGNQQKAEIKQEEESQEKNSLETIASVIDKIPRAVVRQTTTVIPTSEIPQDLIDKLEELEIPLDDRVRSAIAKHHLSQAYGAIAHIENTWETINTPRGVFLYQLPRQPVEAIGTRGRLRTARDFGFTLTDIQKMYGANWRDAAAHFGVEVPEAEVRSSEGAARVFDSGVRSCLTSTPNSDEEVTP